MKKLLQCVAASLALLCLIDRVQAVDFETPVPGPRIPFPFTSAVMDFTVLQTMMVGPDQFVSSAVEIQAVIGRNDTPAVKAQKLADAINAKIPGNPATVVPGNPPTLKIKNGCGMVITRDFTNQLGNGGRVVPGNPQNPPPPGPAKGSIDSTGQTPTSATGLNADDNPSTVMFGIEEQYVSQIHPTANEPSLQVLGDLMADLENHGIDMNLDSQTEMLSFADEVPAGDGVLWGSDDLGLAFSYDMEMILPEPSSVLAVIAMGGCFMRRSRKSISRD